MRERLIELLLESEPIKERDMDDDWLDGEIADIADYLLANGVVVLQRDGNDFNPDLYCPYCGNNLSAAEVISEKDVEKK